MCVFYFVIVSYELTFLTNIYHILLYFAHIPVLHVPTFHFYGDFCDFCGDFVVDFGDFSLSPHRINKAFYVNLFNEIA